jgi:hypothetical protein
MVSVKRIRRGGRQQQHGVRLKTGKQQHAECFPVAVMWSKQVHVALRKVALEVEQARASNPGKGTSDGGLQ